MDSWEAMELALRARGADGTKPSDGTKLLLVGLAREVRPDNGPYVWPGNATLADRLDVTERTVRRRKQEAKASGLIEATPRQRDEGRGRTSDLIRLTFLPDQPDASLPLIALTNRTHSDDQSDNLSDQPDAAGTTNGTPASPEPEENQKKFEPEAQPVERAELLRFSDSLRTHVGGDATIEQATAPPACDGPPTGKQLESLSAECQRLQIGHELYPSGAAEADRWLHSLRTFEKPNGILRRLLGVWSADREAV
jgi:hypothetical protein